MRALDQIYPEGIHLPEFFFGKNIVHLPTVKCHIYTTTTGAMKNAFGGLLNTRRHYTHSWIHETLVDLLTIQKEIHSGLFAVMDGTTCGNGPGPRTMIRWEGLLLASGDQVAIDAVAAKIMGFDPMSITYIRWRTRPAWAWATRATSRSWASTDAALELPLLGRGQFCSSASATSSGSGRSTVAAAVLPYAARQRLHPGE